MAMAHEVLERVKGLEDPELRQPAVGVTLSLRQLDAHFPD